MSALIEAKNVSYSYKNAPHATLKNINLSIEEGEYIALVGKNGSGKSTLAKILTGLLTADSGEIKKKKEVKVAYIYQNPYDNLIANTVLDDTKIALFSKKRFFSRKEEEILESKAKRYLSYTNSEGLARNKTFTLSMGEAMRASISGVLAIEASLYIFDECTAGEDKESKKRILDILEKINKEGATVIHITHDKEAIMRGGRVIELKEGVVEGEYKRAEYIRKIFDINEAINKRLGREGKKKESRKKDNRSLVLEVKGVSYSYKGKGEEHVILKNASFCLEKGRLYALEGDVGAGKSTLFELLAGVRAGYKGEVRAKTRPLLSLQNSYTSIFEKYCADEVAYGAINQGYAGSVLLKRVEEAFTLVGLNYKEFCNKECNSLSGGQKKRLALAAILAMDADILLFDEPTSSLDNITHYRTLKLLRALTDKGYTVLFSTHEETDTLIADTVYTLTAGIVTIKEGEKEKVRKEGSGRREKKNKELKVYYPHAASSILDTIAALFNVRGQEEKSLGRRKWAIMLSFLTFLFLFTLIVSAKSVCFVFFFFIISLVAVRVNGGRVRAALKRVLKLLPFLLFFTLFQLLLPSLSVIDKIRNIASILFKCEAACCLVIAYKDKIREKEVERIGKLLLTPLKLLHIETAGAEKFCMLTLRFIPLLLEELQTILKTYLVRSAERKEGRGKGLKKVLYKIRIMLPLIVPLVLRAIKRARIMAEALTIRQG